MICSKSSSGTVERLKFMNLSLSLSLAMRKAVNRQIDITKQMIDAVRYLQKYFIFNLIKIEA